MTPAESAAAEQLAENLGRWLATTVRERLSRGERCARIEVWLAWGEDAGLRAGGGSRGQAGDWRVLQLGGEAEP